MSNLAVAWSSDKYKRLEAQLVGFWANNIWDMKNCPTNIKGFASLKFGRRYLKFLCPSAAVNNEVKYVVWVKLTNGEWKSNKIAKKIAPLLNWFKNGFPSTIRSLTQQSVAELENDLTSFLTMKGVRTTINTSFFTKAQGVVKYKTNAWPISALREIYSIISDYYDNRSVYEKDLWDLDKLGFKRTSSNESRRLNFTRINQQWLRKIGKIYLHYCLSIYSLSYCGSILVTLNDFSAFLLHSYPNITATKVDRSLILDYLAYLASRGLSTSAKTNHLVNLRTFFEICAREGWGSFPKERIIYSEDFPKEKKLLPRFIPDDVLNQLFQNLDKLPVHVQRMTFILCEVGMRISELVSLQFDCLMQDAEGGWWIKYYQNKLKQDHTQPITANLASIIQAQQKDVIDRRGTSTLLFPNSKGKFYRRRYFAEALNRLAVENNICDSTGKVWWFEAHQFRHAFGTKCINNGMPHNIVQRLMGHKSPTMTSRYAHIHEHTLKLEFEKAWDQRKLIDISGRVIKESSAADASEFQWLKKYVDARTLPNGYCCIPTALAPCPHPNACLTCAHFRTDQAYLATHQQQLSETQKLVQISRANGWATQTENNEKIIANLEKIISSLKEVDDDTSA